MDRIAMQSAKPCQKTQRAGGSCAEAARDSAENRESFSKGYWDRVVNRLAYLEADDALELVFSPDESITSMKSSIHTAAKRAGVRLRS